MLPFMSSNQRNKMIPRKGNLQVAQTILSIIELKLDEADIGKHYIECYANGREHGFCIQHYQRCIAFSECRNSDQIVIYVGSPHDFSMAGNIPSDEVYRAAKFFDYDKHAEATDYIIGLMKQSNAEWTEILAKSDKKTPATN
jgi:hypothetical protein